MTLQRSIPLLALALLVLTLPACVSLAADVTPPPNYQPSQAVEPVSVEAALPLVPPDLNNGATIFADKCADCHGATGKSDGPMTAELPELPPELGNPTVAAQVRPVDWFMVVSNGNLQKLMPGFSGSLSERERWDVTAYALMLSVDEGTLSLGQQVYETDCQVCHGEQGQGNGAQAAGLPTELPNWKQNPAALADRSNAEVKQMIAAGVPPAMPAFASQLEDEQIAAVAAYVRSLAFKGQEIPMAQATPAPGTAQTPQPTATVSRDGEMVIGGQVYNLSGGVVPAGLEARLAGFEGMAEVASYTTPVQPEGVFRFDNVEIEPGRVYLASVEYQGVTYNSEVVHPDSLIAGGSIDNLVIELFESTSDISALKADRMHIFFEPTQSGTVQIVELFILNNTGKHVIVPAGEDQPVFTVELPEGAQNLRFEDGELGEQYLATENGFGDMHTILPGAGAQLMFAYEVPFDGRTDLSISIPVPVDAAVLMAPMQGLQLESEQLVSAGERPVENMQLRLYTAGHLQSGDDLEVALSDGSGLLSRLGGATTNLLIGAAGFAVVLLVAGVWLMRQRRSRADENGRESQDSQPAEDTVSGILDEIIALDDLYRAGEIPEDVYQQRRAELKKRLQQLQEQP